MDFILVPKYVLQHNTKTLICVKCFYVRALKLSPPVHSLNAIVTVIIVMGLENQPSECILHLASYIVSYKRSISSITFKRCSNKIFSDGKTLYIRSISRL